MLAEKSNARNRHEHKEIECHQAVVSDRRRRDHFTRNVERIGERREIDATADVRSSHHAGDPLEIRNVALEQRVADHRADRRAAGAEQKQDQQLAGFSPDLAQVALHQQQRNRQRHHVAPDDVVEPWCVCWNDAKIRQSQRTDQRNDRA